MSITIFLADDHPVVRQGLQLILDTQPDLKVVGAADNGRDAVQQVTQACPEIVIIDISMPELNGIEATRQIREVCPATHVLILSIHSTTKLILRAFQAGADGYLLKGSAIGEVIEAIRTISTGRRYLSHKISDPAVEAYLTQPKADIPQDPLERLSSREREVLQLVVEGKSSPEIADHLHLSTKTVETYRIRLMRKLNLRDLPSLVKFAIQHGLTPLE